MDCKGCSHYEEPDKDCPQGQCGFFRNKSGRLDMDSVDLAVHGAHGCIHRESGPLPLLPGIPVKRDYHDVEDVRS